MYNTRSRAKSKNIVQINSIKSDLNADVLQIVFSKPVYTTMVKICKQCTHPTLGLQLKNNDDKGLHRYLYALMELHALKFHDGVLFYNTQQYMQLRIL